MIFQKIACILDNRDFKPDRRRCRAAHDPSFQTGPAIPQFSRQIGAAVFTHMKSAHVHLSTCLSVCLSVCLHIFVSACLCVWMSAFWAIYRAGSGVRRSGRCESLCWHFPMSWKYWRSTSVPPQPTAAGADEDLKVNANVDVCVALAFLEPRLFSSELIW